MKKSINSKDLVLNAKDKKSIISTIESVKDGFKKTEQLLADPILTALFAELSANELMEKLHGTEWKNNSDLALIVDRKRTKLGDAINYLKRVAKKSLQAGSDENNGESESEKSKEPKLKKTAQIQQELDYLVNNFSKYSDAEQLAVVNMIKATMIRLKEITK